MSTRTALLDHAESFARVRGFDAFSYADLAESVGIRKASIHHHFRTKADLALAMIDRYSLRFLEGLAAIEQTAGSAGAALEAYVALYRAASDQGRQLCLCVAFSAGRDSLSAPVLDALEGFHSDNLAWLDRLFTRASGDGSITDLRDPAAEAHAALALVEGAQLMARAARDGARFEAAVAALTQRIR